jgi:hypothetical protein
MKDVRELKGPSMGICDESSIQSLMDWYREIVALPGLQESTKVFAERPESGTGE